ncbi:DUF2513 domain-containing protein [Vibrio parahaemolyticus]|nr:DUF2513 domain-containing protein [Vibrio parahaemolyticus]
MAKFGEPMKVDYEYLKQLLESFEKVEVPFPWVQDIADSMGIVDNQFAFHMDLLLDQGFIQYLSTEGTSPFIPESQGDDFDYIDVHVRLTAHGYDFLSALRQKDIWNAIKDDLKENSIQTIWNVAQNAAAKIASEKLQKYVGSSS